MHHSETYQAGLDMLRQVLGPEHVEQSPGSVSDSSGPIQEWATEYDWGQMRSMDGLCLPTRSLLTPAVLTAVNGSDELALHGPGAVRNGSPSRRFRRLSYRHPYVGVPAEI